MATRREDDGTATVNKLLGVKAPPAAVAAPKAAAAPTPKAATQVDVYGEGNRIADGTLKSNNPALTAALDEAAKQWHELSSKRVKVEGGWANATPPAGAERELIEAAFKKAGVDPKLIPERADLSAYRTIGGYNGVGADPLRLLQESERYQDGRTKDEANTRDFIAKGLANGQDTTEIWKNIESYNDTTRGKNEGLFNNLSNGISHVGKVVAENPIAQTVITMAAAAYGIPPNVTMALLAANNIGQGQDPAKVLKNVVLQYAAGQVGDYAKGAAGSALKGSGVGDVASKALTNTAGQAAQQLVTTGKLDARGLASGTLTGAAQGYASNALSGLAADYGLDKLKMPEGIAQLGGNLVSGISANNAKQLLSLTPGGKQVVGVVNTLQKPTIGGIASLVGKAPAKQLLSLTPGGKQVVGVVNTLQKPTIGGVASLVGKVPAEPVRTASGAKPPPGVLRQRQG